MFNFLKCYYLVLILALMLIWGICHDWDKSYSGARPESLNYGLIIYQGNTLAPISSIFHSYMLKMIGMEGKYGGQCVYFVQQFLEIFDNCDEVDCKLHPFRGYAGDILPNSTKPKIGNAVLFKSHVAVIIGIENNQLELIESNLNRDETITVGRIIDKNSEKIKGYFDFTKVTI